MKVKTQIAIGMLMATANLSSYAATPGDIYVTGSLGYTSQSDTDYDGSAIGFKVGGGYVITPNLGVEGYWIKHGETDDKFGDTTVKFDTSAIVVQAVGMFPVNPQIDIFGKLGLAMWDGDVTIEDSFETISGSNDGSDLIYGIGGVFHLNDKLDIRAEFETSDFDGLDVTFISAGVNYKIK